MSDPRQATLTEASRVLLHARESGPALDTLPGQLVPADPDEASLVQDQLAANFGEIGGWKIGAPNPDATPLFAPMPKAWMAAEGATLSGPRWRFRGLEAEVAFLVGKDLPPRSQPYTRDEVLAAMASCHPAIEVLETAFRDPAAVPRFAMMADLQMHGGFVPGPGLAIWHNLDFTREQVTLSVNGTVQVQRTGSNTAGDLLRLLPWLANEGAVRTGGLRAGQWITTGSWTGNTPASAGSSVEARFSHLGAVHLQFA